ncbi:hypothetical protein [uncultured Mucilaginibacter sp.]|uniref:LpxL/LpxP family acyltransferase n=1 Tax=uncultured Mucilaginibacter sp. TaxID=797541 RepID=UPI0025FD177C|nr:hypothetical protein [uncultured Mucilaginibacter sp.]
MKTPRPFFLSKCISICSCLSTIFAAIHYSLLSARLIKIPLYISYGGEPVFKNLINIWYIRLVRRVISVSVRSPLRMSALCMVNSTLPLPSHSGCIIAICHTPWKRLLVQWCLENNMAFVIGNGTWTNQKRRIQKRGKGFSDLRDIVSYLQHNGRIVIAFDCFSNYPKCCPVKFLGKSHNMSMLPVRLARVAKVPLVTAIPRFCNGMINIDCGPQFSLNKLNSDPKGVMQTLISFLESEIKNNPATWPANYYQFAALNNVVLN